MKERFLPILLDRELADDNGAHLAAPLTREDAAFMGAVPENPLPAPMFVAGVCTSTFDLAWELSKKQAMPAWSGVLSLAQTSGRGQLRREWVSPSGNLYVSFFLPEDMGQLGDMASLATGLCIHAALGAVGIATRLKWPNDLLFVHEGNEGKFGGLLLEERAGRLLAGLGLNLRSAPGDAGMRKSRAVPAVALAGFNGTVFGFWRELAQGLQDAHTRLIDNTPRESIRERIEDALAWKGRWVYAEDSDEKGVITGLDTNGALLLRTGAGIFAVTSGSIVPI